MTRPYLGPEHTDLLRKLSETWLQRAFRVGQPDRGSAELATRALLHTMNKRPPRHVLWVRSPIEGVVAATVCANRLLEHAGIDPNDRYLGHELYQHWRLTWARELRSRGFDGIEIMEVTGQLDDICAPRLGAGGTWWDLRVAHGHAIARDLEGGGLAAVWGRVREDVAHALDLPPNACDAYLHDFRHQATMCWFGPMEPHLLATIDLFQRTGVELRNLGILLTLASHCGVAWLMSHLCVLSEFPVRIERSEIDGRPGPFKRVHYADGWTLDMAQSLPAGR